MNPTSRYQDYLEEKVMKKTKNELVGHMKGFLLRKKVTLWKDWDLTDPQRLEEAAVWFVNTLEETGLVEIEEESEKI
jgi:hypothetical protein